MRTPQPGGRGPGGKFFSDGGQVQRFAPRKFQRLKFQVEPPRLLDQPAAEFAVAQHQTGPAQERQLSCDHVVGQRAGTHQQLDIPGADEVAENPSGGLKILFKAIAAV